ncbi:MAG: hypothetical protein ACOYEG_14030 [Petrimonas sp.]|jgi:hypothetical protein
MRKLIGVLFMTVMLSSCGTFVNITRAKMEKLELGMTKKEVVNILGRGYKIAEKRIDSGKEIEVLSYQDSPQEYYFFLFENNSLQEWYRELIPKYEK